MCKEVNLDFTVLMAIVHAHHLTAPRHLALKSGLLHPSDTRECSISLRLLYSVHISGHAEYSCVLRQRAGGDRPLGYHTHCDVSSIAMAVGLCLALPREPMQKPSVAHSITKTS